MDVHYGLCIFSLLLLTVHCSLELASSSAQCFKSSKVLQARQGEIRGSTRHGAPGAVNCSWVITSPVGERVVLSFSEFSIRCGWSWLSLTTVTGRPVSLCGYQLPKPMEFRGGNITVTHHFVPHFSVSGFHLSYIKDTGPCYPGEFECYSERCLPMSWHCNGQVECLGEGDELGSDEEDCDPVKPQPHLGNEPSPFPPSEIPASSASNSEMEHLSDLLSPAQGGPCGGYLQAFYGSFVPPVLTGVAMECVWSVDPQDSRPLKLELQQLALGSGDSLIITDQPAGGGSVITTVTYIYNYKTVEVESPTGLLSVIYHVQEASEGRGFNATYRIADYCLPWEGLCKGSEGGCYTPKQRCDGHWDCAETGLDEDGCGGCSAGYFPCGTLPQSRAGHLSRPTCYSIKERCNYQLNCADGSDERECKVCQPGTFHCDSDRCVFESWRCDGQVDCKDGTDELNCTVTLPRKVITAATVGSLVCGLLLVIAMGCTCKLYSLRTREYSLFAPISRQEAEFIQQQAPPSYGQLIAQGIIPPVEDFPTENPNEPTSLSLRGLLQLIRQDNISPRRRRRPRFVRRAVRRLRRWGLISRPTSRSTQTTSSTTQQTEVTPTDQEPRQSGPPSSSVPRENADQPLPQKVGLSQQTEQEQQTDTQPSLSSPPPPPPPPTTLPTTTHSLQPADAPQIRQSLPVTVAPSSPSLASLFHSLGLSISRFRPSSSSPTTLPLSASPSFSSSSEDEVLLIPLSDDTTSEDDVPMLT
ncbi:low-density lipoprotein receptor-related protein 10 [Tachysurus vachellii]|uniref:low-density lipoprotein receptor-related protein 10 n=1 Tax=Tachysurus vachellii TaxID=175792 RepID=UPI00296AA269|nr:low-density lipoprotein receptor-related protein 10 [Tachysurus vachellii]XP_060730854.1 low-density lipoprotein receptor-related protein 10 [Tachysurus vachellii]